MCILAFLCVHNGVAINVYNISKCTKGRGSIGFEQSSFTIFGPFNRPHPSTSHNTAIIYGFSYREVRFRCDRVSREPCSGRWRQEEIDRGIEMTQLRQLRD